MRKIFSLQVLGISGTVIAVLMLVNSQNKVQAKLKYLKAFQKKYPKLAAQAKKVRCGVCHPGKNRKMRNDYGKVLAKIFKKNPPANSKAIHAALKKTEAAKNAKGVTFGSLIKAGKLPGSPPQKK
ncbi:MAG: hypothetical protein Tsb009_12180 [Planctomycetaceae bacterium]